MVLELEKQMDERWARAVNNIYDLRSIARDILEEMNEDGTISQNTPNTEQYAQFLANLLSNKMKRRGLEDFEIEPKRDASRLTFILIPLDPDVRAILTGTFGKEEA